MYEGNVNGVKVGGERSKWLEHKSGLRQGSTLSSLLFIIGMDEVMGEVVRNEIWGGKDESYDICRWFDNAGEKWSGLSGTEN